LTADTLVDGLHRVGRLTDHALVGSEALNDWSGMIESTVA
jgi:hypothetical protein